MPASSRLPRPTRHDGHAPSGAVVVSRRAVRAAAGTIALLAAWAAATTGYIALHDEVAQTFFARQTELRYAYEDRIADLKNRLEREITANLVETKTASGRTDAIAARQAEIETRQAWLRDVLERLGPREFVTGSIRPADGTPSRLATPSATLPVGGAKPAPLADEPAQLRLRSSDAGTASADRDRLAAVETSLRRVSEASLRQADELRRGIRDKAMRIRTALDVARIDLRRLQNREGAVGGPLVPLPATFDAGALAPTVQDAESAMAELGQLASVTQSLPLGRPLGGHLEATSSFGYRLDPFTRGAALHTGIDLRAEPGSPVRATASGRVVSAEFAGGYGNMVEIEHEDGFSTRYGHLSATLVVAGQLVAPGQIVGRAGSTGRSTGTHLHYETRVRGEAVDPTRFLEAGRLLADARSEILFATR